MENMATIKEIASDLAQKDYVIDTLVAALRVAKPFIARYERERPGNVAAKVLEMVDSALSLAGRS